MTNSDLQRREADLITKCNRELSNGLEKDPVERLRLLCLSRGATGIIGLSRYDYSSYFIDFLLIFLIFIFQIVPCNGR